MIDVSGEDVTLGEVARNVTAMATEQTRRFEELKSQILALQYVEPKVYEAEQKAVSQRLDGLEASRLRLYMFMTSLSLIVLGDLLKTLLALKAG